MKYSRLLSKQIPAEEIVDAIKKAIAVIYALPVENFNSEVFFDIAVGFKNIVYNMESGSTNSFPLFLKWMKLYVRVQHQIDPNNEILYSKFEKKIPLCTSYIVASLQYQTKMANYHLQAMDMCLSLFNTASDDVMMTVANLDMEIIGLFWSPIEFVGDFNTQKMCLKLIAKVFDYLDETQKQKRLSEIKTSTEIRNMLLKLTENQADFEKISRELLNNFNMKTTSNCAVFSVYCRSALFGCYELFRPKDVDRFWIDFNYATKSVSLQCDVKLRKRFQERISIQIKIDKLQIENQFDCIVLSIEPAIFSKSVSTELSNARIAVFTLPQSEVQRLLANRDLIDFYNKTGSYPCSDLMEPRSQNTIDNFLAEEQEGDGSGDALEIGGEVTLDVADAAILENSRDNRSMRRQANAQGLRPKERKDDATAKSKTKTTLSATVVKQPEVSKKNQTKETGCSPCISISIPKSDSPTFKVPAKPVRRRPSQNAASKTPPKPSQNVGAAKKRKQSSRSKNTTKSQRTDAKPNQSSAVFGNASKRFFKGTASKPPDLPRTQTIPKPRKKPSTIRNSGVSPKRKQVNTVRPLNHLTQPNCDPQEAALEYVENGGYANIISFIQSSAGLASFNDQQRQQILENVEKINEDLDRSSRHFFPKALSSSADSYDDDGGGKSRPKKKQPPKGTENKKFVPFSTWKVQQREKSNEQSDVSTVKPKDLVPASSKVDLNTFDRLKDNENEVSASQLTSGEVDNSPLWDALNSKYPSSVSSGSNHNFLIVESDNEPEGSEMDMSAADMECRRDAQDMELTMVPTPTHTAHTEDTMQTKKNTPTSPQVSLSSSASRIVETPFCEPDPKMIICELTEDWASDYQASEIFEDLDGVPPNSEPQAEAHANESDYSSLSEDPDDLQKEIPSTEPHQGELESNPNEEPASQCENHSPIITPREAQPGNSWYIEKYLNDQQLFNQSPINVEARTTSPRNPRPNVVTTNQVIIQNQFVVTAGRKRPSPPHDESPISKMSLDVDQVSLRGYAQLLPEYMKKLTAEKNRILSQLERGHQESYFEKITQIFDEILKTMVDYETEINEVQEQLSFCLGRLEWLIENQQKKRSQLEGVCSDLIRRIQSSIPEKQEVRRTYEAAEDELTTLATTTGSQLWQGFANNIVTSIETRLRDLVHF